MEERVNAIPIHYTNAELNALMAGLKGNGPYTRHFTQTEDFFLRFPSDFVMRQFPIHHDITNRKPHPDYLAALAGLISDLARLAPDVFSNLTYFFDPQEIFKPCFYRLYKIKGRSFLFLLRLDLGFRPSYQVIVERGDNDTTNTWRSSCLFLEPLCIPLDHLDAQDGKLHGFHIRSLFSETWIGEYGRGYFVQGIWMDNDLTKFFTRLVLQPEQQIYPYYPFLCKYRTICAMIVRFSEEERAAIIPVQDHLIEMLKPYLPEIQNALKESAFSDTLPLFRSLKDSTAYAIPELWNGLRIRTYINEAGLKEFMVDEHDTVVSE